MLLLAGCAHSPPAGPQAAAAPVQSKPAPVEVTIEHLPAPAAWRVRYAFPTPQAQVVFGRGGKSTRARWRVLEPVDATLEADGERGVVRRKDGAPLSALVLGLEDDFEKPEKNYQPVIPYGDGGRLFYTGYIDPDIVNDVFFTFVPRSGEHVVARGQRSEQPLRTDWVPNGTYAYFGKTEPRTTQAGLAVVDGAMPPWLREELERALPAFLALYAQRTGHPLPTRPVVFMSYTEDTQHPGSQSFGGGVLPGIVQLDVRLGTQHVGKRDPLVLERALWLAAHEGAHLWNGDLFTSEEQGAEWLPEGGANAFARRGLHEIGAVTAEATREAASVSLSLCLLGLREVALKDSSREGAWRNHYNCGETLALFTEAALRRADPKSNLFAFWGEVFERAKERHYDSALYLSTLEARAGAEAAATVRALLGESGPEAEGRWREALRSVGVETARDEAAMPEEVRLAISAAALRLLARHDCAADVSAQPAGNGAIVAGTGCRTLPPRAKVVRVGDLPWGRGPAVHGAIAQRCAKGLPVRLMLEGGRTLDVPCKATLPPAPGYVHLMQVWPEASAGSH